MSILTPYKDAGVRTFTVQNGNAIADNPYEIIEIEYRTLNIIERNNNAKFWTFEQLNLPPLPTSGIPDGPVSIEEVEPQWQCAYSWDARVWRNISDKYYEDMKDATANRYRQALIPKALRKGEEEKPKGEQCLVKFSDLASYVLYDIVNDAYIPLDDSDLYFHISGGQVNGVFYRSEEYYEGGGEIHDRETFEEIKSFKIELKPQPEKMEQTAEGIETSSVDGQGYTLLKHPTLDTLREDWVEEIYTTHFKNMPEAVRWIFEHVHNPYVKAMESQLAQYKEKVIGELEAKLNREDPRFQIYNSDGIREVIDLIKNTKP